MKKLFVFLVTAVAFSACQKCDEPGYYSDCTEWRDAITGTWTGQVNCSGNVTIKTDEIINGGTTTSVLWSDGFRGELVSGNELVIQPQTVNGIEYSGFGMYSETELNYQLNAIQNGQTVTCYFSAGR
jgi:hypothetical protein